MAKRGEEPVADERNSTGASRYAVSVATRGGRFLQTSTVLPHLARALSEFAGIASKLSDECFSRLPMFDSAEDPSTSVPPTWGGRGPEAQLVMCSVWVPGLSPCPVKRMVVLPTSGSPK